MLFSSTISSNRIVAHTSKLKFDILPIHISGNLHRQDRLNENYPSTQRFYKIEMIWLRHGQYHMGSGPSEVRLV